MSDTDDAVVGESSDAQVDELDSLLSDFGQPDQTGTEPQNTPVQDVTKDDIREMVQYSKQDRHAREMEQTNAAIDSACKTVFENLPEGVLPERAVRGLLIDMADSDQRFQKAFFARGSNPAQWNKILSATAKEMAKEFATVDKDLSEDKEAIASAVRSASTKVPEAQQDEASRRKEIAGMSDQELRAEKRRLGAY